MIKKKCLYCLVFAVALIVINACSTMFLPTENKGNNFDSKIDNYRNGEFVNTNPIEGMNGSFFKVAYKFIFENKNSRTPNFEIPIECTNVGELISDVSISLSTVWLGHAANLINIDGTIILTDPMLTKWASPIAWLGPKRFFNSPIKIENLPIIDAVLISHNHYDHLDKESILRLNAKTKKFIVPLGVEKLLFDWGISANKVVSQNWWNEFELNDSTKIITTPAQHFSGRGLFDRNKTLWASYVIKSKNHKVFFGGDSGYFDGYKEIGEKYGPFDMTYLPIGAYNKMWRSIHMNPEEAVKANSDLKGTLLVPIHWGTFNLALHSWVEPAERLIIAAEDNSVSFVIPRPGAIVRSNNKYNNDKWWIHNKIVKVEK